MSGPRGLVTIAHRGLMMSDLCKIRVLRELIATQNSEVLAHLVFRLDGELGVIYCTADAEDADQHCDGCKDELTVFRPRGPSPELPHYYLAVIGPTKFARIRAGWRDTLGLNLNSVEFLDG